MTCQNCKGDRLFFVSGKSDDRTAWSYKGGDERGGYAPYVPYICGGDYVEVKVCLDCGRVQGEFPISEEKIQEALT